MNKRAVLFKISQVLEQYGTPVEVIRDVYTVDENTGLRELEQEDVVVEEDVVEDNTPAILNQLKKFACKKYTIKNVN